MVSYAVIIVQVVVVVEEEEEEEPRSQDGMERKRRFRPPVDANSAIADLGHVAPLSESLYSSARSSWIFESKMRVRR